MSSARFPGKVLAPFRGRPLIASVLDGAAAIRAGRVVLATSDDATDEPLAAYARARGVEVFRGSLHNVFARFRDCAAAYPADWTMRLCGDSPLLQPAVAAAVVAHAGRLDLDVVTTVFPRTFPRGQNVEMVRTRVLLGVDPRALTPSEQEHVTQVFYAHPARYRIANVESRDPRLADLSTAVDSIDDLRRLEAMDVGAWAGAVAG
jgi:spore coat polysaccharide biosynthesis protein SpsF (cytidylyltransferase family)